MSSCELWWFLVGFYGNQSSKSKSLLWIWDTCRTSVLGMYKTCCKHICCEFCCKHSLCTKGLSAIGQMSDFPISETFMWWISVKFYVMDFREVLHLFCRDGWFAEGRFQSGPLWVDTGKSLFLNPTYFSYKNFNTNTICNRIMIRTYVLRYIRMVSKQT